MEKTAKTSPPVAGRISSPAPARSIRKPFATSALEILPALTADDPPYRSWWAVEDENEENGN